MPGVSSRIPNRRHRPTQNHPAEGRPIPKTYAWSVNTVELKQSNMSPTKPGRFTKNLTGKVVYSPNKPGPVNFTVDYNWAAPEQQTSRDQRPFAERPKSAPPSKWNYMNKSGTNGPIFSTTELNDDSVSQRFMSPNYLKNNNTTQQRPKSDGPINRPSYRTHLSPPGAIKQQQFQQRPELSVEERLRSLVSPSAGIPDSHPTHSSKQHYEDNDILLPPKKDRTASTDDSVFYDNEAFEGRYSPFRGIAQQLGTKYIPSRPSEKKPGPRAEVILNRHTPTTVPPPYHKLPSYHQSTAFIRNNENQDELQDICNRLNKLPEDTRTNETSQQIHSILPAKQSYTNKPINHDHVSMRPNPVGESSPSSRNSSFLSALGEGYISYSKPGIYPHFTNTSSATVPSSAVHQYSTRPKDNYVPQYYSPDNVNSSQVPHQRFHVYDGRLIPSESLDKQNRMNKSNTVHRSEQHGINPYKENIKLQDLPAQVVESRIHDSPSRVDDSLSLQPDQQYDDSEHEDSSQNSTSIPKLGDPFSELQIDISRALVSDEESMRSVTPPLPPLSPTTSAPSTPSYHQSSHKYSPPAPDLITNTTEISMSPTRRSPHIEVKRKKSTSRLTRNASYEKRLQRLGMNESSESDIEISSSTGPERSRTSPVRAILTNQTESHDAAVIHKKLDGLEVMYHEILKMLGVEKDFIMSKRRNSTSSLDMGKPASRFQNVTSQKTRNKDMKLIDKRFARLESHVVTLARSVAHLSSEMRQHNIIVDELESVKQELFTLKQQQQQQHNIGIQPERPLTEWEKFRKWVSSITNPRRVNKLRRFFGQDPLLYLFLEKLGYEKYAQRLDAEKIGMIELPYLTEDRLQKIGIPMGPRLRILQEAQLCFRQENLDIYII